MFPFLDWFMATSHELFGRLALVTRADMGNGAKTKGVRSKTVKETLAPFVAPSRCAPVCQTYVSRHIICNYCMSVVELNLRPRHRECRCPALPDSPSLPLTKLSLINNTVGFAHVTHFCFIATVVWKLYQPNCFSTALSGRAVLHGACGCVCPPS